MTVSDIPRRIGFLLIDGFALMSYAAAVEPLRAANLLAGRALYDVVNMPASGGFARASCGAVVPRDGDAAETVFVVAAGDPFSVDETLFPRLRGLAARGTALGGISGGPVVLALAGLMEGRRMAVHWEHAPALAARAPGALIERSLYVVDRDRITCAGGAAPMDLMHVLIARDHGAAFAREVADWFHHTDPRPSAGAQRAGLADRYGVLDRAVLDALEMMESHLADPLTLEQLASVAAVSPRHLNRLFRERLGQSAMAFYRGLRLGRARDLLAATPLSVAEAAAATGFASAAHFSRRFSEMFGAAPSELRRKGMTRGDLSARTRDGRPPQGA